MAHVDRGVVAGLILDVPASGLTGTYIGGVARVGGSLAAATPNNPEKVIASSTKLFTASKDTYAYIDKDGVIQYTEKTLGAAKPTQADIGVDSEFLWKAVTDGSDVTAVDMLAQPAAHGELITLIQAWSFITASQGAVYTRVPSNVRILLIDSVVTEDVSGTDAGTITFAIGLNGVFVNVTGGVVTVALSSANGVRDDAIPTALRFAARGNLIRGTSLKTTTAGAGYCSLLCEVTH